MNTAHTHMYTHTTHTHHTHMHTTGLDSASSLEILKSLSMLAETGRAVVITIHQPRSEIFHSFDKILLLCNGQVAFFGSPVKVWDFFSDALDYEDETQVLCHSSKSFYNFFDSHNIMKNCLHPQMATWLVVSLCHDKSHKKFLMFLCSKQLCLELKKSLSLSLFL